jgi:hypothetical protein
MEGRDRIDFLKMSFHCKPGLVVYCASNPFHSTSSCQTSNSCYQQSREVVGCGVAIGIAFDKLGPKI